MINVDCVAIWQAVVLQVAKDLKTESKKYMKKNYKNNARKYLYSEDFKNVCDLAGYNYNYILKRMERLIK